MKIIIIGAGIAAVSAIQAIRQQDKNIEISVYGEESKYPYKRIRLTKDLAKGLDEEKLLIEKQAWYQENHAKMMTGKKVVRIDPATQRIFLSDGTIDEYKGGALLLANGARNNVPPIKGIDKVGVYTLRSLEDARRILEQAKHSKRILVIGGGVLGLEIAWSLKQLEKDVVVAEALPRLMPRQLDEAASAILQDIILDSGVSVYTGIQVKEITGEASVTGYITDNNQQQPCDMVIHSTGIRPNIELVKDTGVRTNRGILVNEKMETNIPGIYAAGDVAEYNDFIPGLWNVASLQGETAGSNMAGLNIAYKVPALATVMNAFRYSMFSVGLVEEKSSDKVIVEEVRQDRKYQKLFFKDRKMIGAVFMGSIKELPVIKKAVEGNAVFPEVYESQLSLSEFLQHLKEKEEKKQLLQPVGAAAHS